MENKTNNNIKCQICNSCSEILNDRVFIFHQNPCSLLLPFMHFAHLEVSLVDSEHYLLTASH